MTIELYTTADKTNLMEIWEAAVRSSHYFLKEGNIKQIREDIINKNYLDTTTLWTYKLNQKLVDFIGVNNGHIDMLFIDPKYQSKGIGRQLIGHIRKLYKDISACVNEQNQYALSFYLKYGFKQVGRSEKDPPEGRPFPILHLKLID